MFDAANWYWHADDGRVFSSSRQQIVSEADGAFKEAMAHGAVTRWPHDEAGRQTNESLQSVLTPYALWVDLKAYAADRRWRKEVGGVVFAEVPIATDDRSKLMITGARLAAAADPAWTTIWHGSDGGTYPLDAETMLLISDGVQAHVNETFAVFAAVLLDIENGVISTMEQVDAAFA